MTYGERAPQTQDPSWRQLEAPNPHVPIKGDREIDSSTFLTLWPQFMGWVRSYGSFLFGNGMLQLRCAVGRISSTTIMAPPSFHFPKGECNIDWSNNLVNNLSIQFLWVNCIFVESFEQITTWQICLLKIIVKYQWEPPIRLFTLCLHHKSLQKQT